MEDLHEIVNLAEVNLAITWLAIVLPVVGLVAGAIAGAILKRLGWWTGRGFALGLIGPIIFVMWRLYSYMIRYDPQTGYCGLHRTSVLLLNVVIFAAVGVALGAAYGRLLRSPTPPTEQPDSGADPRPTTREDPDG